MLGEHQCEMVRRMGQVEPVKFDIAGENRYCSWLGVVCPIVDQKQATGIVCRYSVNGLELRKAIAPAPIRNNGMDY